MTETSDPSRYRPRTRLPCSRGELREAETEDELVEKASEHLAAVHPELSSYTRDEHQWRTQPASILENVLNVGAELN
jgi:hypothetical protein